MRFCKLNDTTKLHNVVLPLLPLQHDSYLGTIMSTTPSHFNPCSDFALVITGLKLQLRHYKALRRTCISCDLSHPLFTHLPPLPELPFDPALPHSYLRYSNSTQQGCLQACHNASRARRFS
jgi:hypothetical protein